MTNSRASQSGITYVIKQTSTTMNSDTTFTDDSELKLTMAASKQYFFKLYLIFNSGTTPDIKYQFTAPSGATGDYAAGDHSAKTPQGVIAIGSSSGTIQTLGTVQTMMAWGRCLTSTTAGNLTLQWAQGTSDAGATTVLLGSMLQLFETK